MTRSRIIALGIVILGMIGLLVYALTANSGDEATEASESSQVTEESDEVPATEDEVATQPSGQYVAYSEAAVADESYETTLLFFHAPWCPECRAFEQAINDEGIPDGVQVLKVDYDSSQDLREEYGVTIQTTFVRVNTAGEKQSLWVGYGEDKSVDAILENT